MDNKEIAMKILDYWHVIEFLGQDSYEMCTGEKTLTNPKKQKDNQYYSLFHRIREQDDIYQVIRTSAKHYEMSTWGNLTFFIGKVKRQDLIEKLSEMLDVPLKQAEKNTDEIPVLSFQCTPEGNYIQHSVSLSPVVWALSVIKKQLGKIRISGLLSEQQYNKTIEKLEKRYFSAKLEDREKVPMQADMDTMPAFEGRYITADKISVIYEDIAKGCKNIGIESMQVYNGIKLQLFKNREAREKYEDDDYYGLSHDFFSSDIDMVKKHLKKRGDDFDKGMLSDLVSYICAPLNGLELDRGKRYDLITPENQEVFYKLVSRICNMKNAPLAKWPSEYVPAFMQQIAINLAISNEKSIKENTRKIFSVNGPPGTGKTTMLKEIIVSNITEKAIILSQYEKPDDAFDKVSFKGGKYNGAYIPPQPGYGQTPFPYWYRFKDKRIADYGILVTSCNNNAVEKITKELPLKSSLVGGLTLKTDSVYTNRGKTEKQLKEIQDLFLGKKEGIQQDVYLTDYAQKLFESENENMQAWGLIAVPLGKRSNINRFNSAALNPLLRKQADKNYRNTHLSEYQKSRDIFLKQLNQVRTLQNKLKRLGDALLDTHEVISERNIIERNNLSAIRKKKDQIVIIDDLYKRTIEIDPDENLTIGGESTEIEKQINRCRKKLKDLSEKEIDYKKQAIEAEKSACCLLKIFNRRKYDARLDLARSCQAMALKCREAASCLSDKVNILNEIQKLYIEIEKANQKVRDSEKKQQKCLKDCESSGVLDTGTVLDEQYVKRIFSPEKDLSLEAQVSNPWATEKYNREREKLFYYALQMTKHFVLSSVECYHNLIYLCHCWGVRTDYGEKVIFKQEEKENMLDSLYNTLFLLVPVISSTFASAGRLFKDIKKPGAIGTLIIDEAGQAQPQMAVGSLFRARRSIVVGDPKQVEPVVTDDLELLKRTFKDSLYMNYKNKSISVQNCADIINPFGTFLENETDNPDWVGCPLLVHRRCISPMFDISNMISYNGNMKQMSLLASEKKSSKFLLSESRWINSNGKENGNGDHFVAEQGEVVCRMLAKAFDNNDYPDLFIISPFRSVIKGIKNAIKQYVNKAGPTGLPKGFKNAYEYWMDSNIGTIHTFQGREADEVILVLGCDQTVKNKYAVKDFVNSNIINVAVTRAKYRVYFIGDAEVWQNNFYVNKAKSIINGTIQS